MTKLRTNRRIYHSERKCEKHEERDGGEDDVGSEWPRRKDRGGGKRYECNDRCPVVRTQGATRAKVRTRNATPERHVHGRGDANFSKQLELQIIADMQDATDECVIPCI